MLLDERSFLFIRERYIERKIFDIFSRDFQHKHTELIKKDFEYYHKVLSLKEALKKGEAGSSYVINMLKIDLIPSAELEGRKLVELNSSGVIVLFDDIMKFRQINDVLYQIRCNTFHGEKTPYGLNDTDTKVVKAAYDVLVNIMESYKDEWEIKTY